VQACGAPASAPQSWGQQLRHTPIAGLPHRSPALAATMHGCQRSTALARLRGQITSKCPVINSTGKQDSRYGASTGVCPAASHLCKQCCVAGGGPWQPCSPRLHDGQRGQQVLGLPAFPHQGCIDVQAKNLRWLCHGQVCDVIPGSTRRGSLTDAINMQHGLQALPTVIVHPSTWAKCATRQAQGRRACCRAAQGTAAGLSRSKMWAIIMPASRSAMLNACAQFQPKAPNLRRS